MSNEQVEMSKEKREGVCQIICVNENILERNPFNAKC